VTEAEVIESLNLHAANAIDAYAIFVSFTFGYLTLAYFAGEKLSIPQVIIVSVLYATSAIVFTLVSITHLESLEVLVLKYPDFVYSSWWKFPWSKVSILLNAGAVIASAYFMVDMRMRVNLTKK
jgi:hypothetical protein